jgi:hypothetical protein
MPAKRETILPAEAPAGLKRHGAPTTLLALDGGFEFFEDAEIRGEEVAAELADWESAPSLMKHSIEQSRCHNLLARSAETRRRT